MGAKRYTEEFRIEAVKQVTDRGASGCGSGQPAWSD